MATPGFGRGRARAGFYTPGAFKDVQHQKATTIKVNNIPVGTTEGDLKSHFSAFGAIEQINYRPDLQGSFIFFSNSESAFRAKKEGSAFHGQYLNINYIYPSAKLTNQPKPPTGDGASSVPKPGNAFGGPLAPPSGPQQAHSETEISPFLLKGYSEAKFQTLHPPPPQLQPLNPHKPVAAKPPLAADGSRLGGGRGRGAPFSAAPAWHIGVRNKEKQATQHSTSGDEGDQMVESGNDGGGVEMEKAKPPSPTLAPAIFKLPNTPPKSRAATDSLFAPPIFGGLPTAPIFGAPTAAGSIFKPPETDTGSIFGQPPQAPPSQTFANVFGQPPPPVTAPQAPPAQPVAAVSQPPAVQTHGGPSNNTTTIAQGALSGVFGIRNQQPSPPPPPAPRAVDPSKVLALQGVSQRAAVNTGCPLVDQILGVQNKGLKSVFERIDGKKSSTGGSALFTLGGADLEGDDEDSFGPPMVGLCETMCPVSEEWNNREAHYFEKPSEDLPFEPIRLKHYKRSDAGSMVKETEIRTPGALRRTMTQLELVMDQDILPFNETYHFVRDRGAAVNKDVCVQKLEGETAIAVREEMIRFLILAEFNMCEEGVRAFSDKQNMQHINKYFPDLIKNYAHARAVGLASPNEAEFWSYFFLLAAETRSLKAPPLPDEIMNSPNVRFALEVLNCMDTESCNNYARLFSLFKTQASMLEACIMHTRFVHIRQSALQMIRTAMLPKQKGDSSPVLSVDYLQRLLGFDTEEETLEFCEYYGYRTNAKGDFDSTSSVFAVPCSVKDGTEQPHPKRRSLYLKSLIDSVWTSEIIKGDVGRRHPALGVLRPDPAHPRVPRTLVPSAAPTGGMQSFFKQRLTATTVSTSRAEKLPESQDSDFNLSPEVEPDHFRFSAQSSTSDGIGEEDSESRLESDSAVMPAPPPVFPAFKPTNIFGAPAPSSNIFGSQPASNIFAKPPPPAAVEIQPTQPMQKPESQPPLAIASPLAVGQPMTISPAVQPPKFPAQPQLPKMEFQFSQPPSLQVAPSPKPVLKPFDRTPTPSATPSKAVTWSDSSRTATPQPILPPLSPIIPLTTDLHHHVTVGEKRLAGSPIDSRVAKLQKTPPLTMPLPAVELSAPQLPVAAHISPEKVSPLVPQIIAQTSPLALSLSEAGGSPVLVSPLSPCDFMAESEVSRIVHEMEMWGWNASEISEVACLGAHHKILELFTKTAQKAMRSAFRLWHDALLDERRRMCEEHWSPMDVVSLAHPVLSRAHPSQPDLYWKCLLVTDDRDATCGMSEWLASKLTLNASSQHGETESSKNRNHGGPWVETLSLCSRHTPAADSTLHLCTQAVHFPPTENGDDDDNECGDTEMSEEVEGADAVIFVVQQTQEDKNKTLRSLLAEHQPRLLRCMWSVFKNETRKRKVTLLIALQCASDFAIHLTQDLIDYLVDPVRHLCSSVNVLSLPHLDISPPSSTAAAASKPLAQPTGGQSKHSTSEMWELVKMSGDVLQQAVEALVRSVEQLYPSTASVHDLIEILTDSHLRSHTILHPFFSKTVFPLSPGRQTSNADDAHSQPSPCALPEIVAHFNAVLKCVTDVVVSSADSWREHVCFPPAQLMSNEQSNQIEQSKLFLSQFTLPMPSQLPPVPQTMPPDQTSLFVTELCLAYLRQVSDHVSDFQKRQTPFSEFRGEPVSASDDDQFLMTPGDSSGRRTWESRNLSTSVAALNIAAAVHGYFIRMQSASLRDFMSGIPPFPWTRIFTEILAHALDQFPSLYHPLPLSSTFSSLLSAIRHALSTAHFSDLPPINVFPIVPLLAEESHEELADRYHRNPAQIGAAPQELPSKTEHSPPMLPSDFVMSFDAEAEPETVSAQGERMEEEEDEVVCPEMGGLVELLRAERAENRFFSHSLGLPGSELSTNFAEVDLQGCAEWSTFEHSMDVSGSFLEKLKEERMKMRELNEMLGK